MVVWGDGDAELPTAIDGVAIVRGRDLPEWLAELPGDLLAPSLVEMAWSAISPSLVSAPTTGPAGCG